MKVLRVLSVLAVASFLFGCASPKISTEERAALKRVIVAAVELPDKPVILAPVSGGAIFFGVLGVVIEQGMSPDYSTVYKKVLEQNQINIAADIKAELKNQLISRGIEVVEDASQADAVMNIEVFRYGLTGDMSSDNRFPQLWATFKLTKRNGDVIWKNTGAAHILKEVQQQVEARPIPDYFNDPKFLDSQIKKVTKIIVMSVTSTL
jgi:hypothetical protein